MLIARGKRKILYYDFTFAGQRFKGSTKTSSRTVAQRAEEGEVEAATTMSGKFAGSAYEVWKTSSTSIWKAIVFAIDQLPSPSMSWDMSPACLVKRWLSISTKLLSCAIRRIDSGRRQPQSPSTKRFLLKMLGSPAGDVIRTSLKESKCLSLPLPNR